MGVFFSASVKHGRTKEYKIIYAYEAAEDSEHMCGRFISAFSFSVFFFFLRSRRVPRSGFNSRLEPGGSEGLGQARPP